MMLINVSNILAAVLLSSVNASSLCFSYTLSQSNTIGSLNARDNDQMNTEMMTTTQINQI